MLGYRFDLLATVATGIAIGQSEAHWLLAMMMVMS